MRVFRIHDNMLAGTVVDVAFSTRVLEYAHLARNWFAGALPAAFVRLSLVDSLDLDSNYFQGAIKGIDTKALFISNNLLAGAIPQQLFVSHGTERKDVVANELFLAGTIPASASRMSMEITMSLGHGLRGTLPRLLGTVALLLLWENALEGLPELHITELSVLL
eukprot:5052947-Amphidinium_carterae.1